MKKFILGIFYTITKILKLILEINFPITFHLIFITFHAWYCEIKIKIVRIIVIRCIRIIIMNELSVLFRIVTTKNKKLNRVNIYANLPFRCMKRKVGHFNSRVNCKFANSTNSTNQLNALFWWRYLAKDFLS